MIVIDANLWPGGFAPTEQDHVGLVAVVNDGTGTGTHGNYLVYFGKAGVTDPFAVIRNKSDRIAVAEVKSWRRQRGVWGLVAIALGKVSGELEDDALKRTQRGTTLSLRLVDRVKRLVDNKESAPPPAGTGFGSRPGKWVGWDDAGIDIHEPIEMEEISQIG